MDRQLLQIKKEIYKTELFNIHYVLNATQWYA